MFRSPNYPQSTGMVSVRFQEMHNSAQQLAFPFVQQETSLSWNPNQNSYEELLEDHKLCIFLYKIRFEHGKLGGGDWSVESLWLQEGPISKIR